MNSKITPGHLARAAYVYIRQSTLHQVRHNVESNRRQYELQGRARELGFAQVVVIDDDLGISAAGTQERPGFGRLLTAVCNGVVGGVFALEASRLARNNRDWHHLIDLCVLTDTVVVDAEGVYDPRLLNDRLLLGLKGTMSEFELGLLRQRAQEAYRQKVLRGEVLTDVPIGYARTEANGIEMTADRQVQEAIRGVFAQFERLGTVRQVLLWYRDEKLRLCHSRIANGTRTVIWEVPSYQQLIRILKNPTYAGAFAYGRTCTRSRVIEGRSRKSGGHPVALDEWQVLLRDHHAGYITWGRYMENQNMMAANRTKCHAASPGAPRQGSALLSGLLRCARCGRKLHVGYSGSDGRVPRYHCRGAKINHGEAWCISFGALRADQAVVEVVLEALQPVGVEASLSLIEGTQAELDHKRRSLELALERARYEADRARRQFDAVDPANRLVAAELESRWNVALSEVAEAEARLHAEPEAREPLSEAQRDRLLSLGSDLNVLWNDASAPVELKKRILRTVINEIVVDLNEALALIEMRIHWTGGVHSVVNVRKNHTGGHGKATDKDVVQLARELARVCSDPAIASILNRLGYRTGVGNSWNESRVRHLRSYNEIPVYSEGSARPWVTMAEAAEILKVGVGVIRTMIKHGMLPAKQVVEAAPWMISPADLERPAVVSYAKRARIGKRAPRVEDGQTVMSCL